jgi:cellulose synthase/poly-beta-1,6-N-acetylglucosamine synthase-like glycosyltransferase
LVELPHNVGKAKALSIACQLACGDIVVFSDARQRWAEDALENMLAVFADPEVGAVSGQLIVESAPGVMAGVGLYWRFEKWLRRSEALVHSTVGVTGAISAVRRALFRPIPKGTILDDLYWPLNVAMQGYRVEYNEQAVAFDRLPQAPRDEFRRKLRTLSGNYQLFARLPAALNPWFNPIAVQLVSHKLMRLIVPWALLGVLVTSALMQDPIYEVVMTVQTALYGIGVAGIFFGNRVRWRVSAFMGSFLLLNAAAWLAFWIWAFGKADTSWRKAKYSGEPDC